ncbi:MAG: GPW/gp25 family protein [Sediminibacterium sp.]
MAITTTKTTKVYKDLDLNFTAHPVKKDINKHVGEISVINSIKNLILTNHYERLFQPDVGSNVKKMLFENMDSITAASLEREIIQVIKNYEPRATVNKLSVIPDYENNGFTVDMEFIINTLSTPVTIQFFLERVR